MKDLGFPIRHLESKLDELEFDNHRLRKFRDESWNQNVDSRILEYKEAIEILKQSQNKGQ